MKKLTFFLLFLPLMGITQYKGIQFEYGSSWTGIKAKAKAENKYIFLYCELAPQCVGCGMDDTVFQSEKTGSFMNDHFISVKVSIAGRPKTPANAINNPFGEQIIQTYHIQAYPTCLFFDPDGNLIHRTTGTSNAKASLIEKAQNALNPETQYYTLLRKSSEAGQNDPVLLRKTALAALKAFEKDTAQKYAGRYLATQENIYTRENLLFIKTLTMTATDIGFKIFLDHADKVDAVLGEGEAEDQVAHLLMQDETLNEIRNYHNSKPTWQNISEAILVSYPTLSPKLLALAKIKWLQYVREWDQYPVAVNEYVNAYHADFSPTAWNHYAWEIFLYCKDTVYLQKALEWSRNSFTNKNVPNHMDTYANLLYKLGKKEEAISWEQKAIELADEKGKKKYQNTISRMNAGERTWPMELTPIPMGLAIPAHLIAWSKKSLRWKDFKRKPDSAMLAGPWGATTSSWIEQRYKITPQHDIQFTIIAWFNPDFSWVKPDFAFADRNNYGLIHEQHHFEMAELYARKIRKVFSNLELTDSSFHKEEISQLFNTFYAEYRLQQERYDRETEHGRNREMQYNWNASIDDEMKALSAYSDTTFIVKIKHQGTPLPDNPVTGMQ